MSETPPYLEAWYRNYLPLARVDISSSGVEPYTFRELREVCGISTAELDELALQDSLTLGSTPLREALARRYAGGDARRVLVTHGSSEAIFLVLGSILGPQDRVTLLSPLYHSLARYVDMSAAHVTRAGLDEVRELVDNGQDWSPLIADGTTVVVVNFPHNPTGYCLTAAAMASLRRRCADIGALLVWDAAFEELPMADTGVALPFEPDERVVRFGTFSKAFGLPGLRVGWAIAPPEILDRTLAVRDRTTLFLSPLIETIATRVVAAADDLIGPRARQARANLALVDRWIQQEAPHVDWHRPTGGVCGLLHLRGLADTESLCLRLLHTHGTMLVPGKAFEAPGAVRLGFGGGTADLVTGLEALREVLHADAR
jgi:capreomycidine synthase